MKDLKDKVVVVTGAASGIGRALALRLSAEGAALALADRDESGLRATADMVGTAARVTTHVVDVGDRARVEAFARETVQAHGRVDVLINNAAVNTYRTVRDSTLEDFEWVLSANLWGTIHTVQAFLPLLEQRPAAHIVNVSSIAGLLPFPMNGPYNVSKAGVAALSETLMVELAGTGIAVTCVHPGGVKTNISRNARYTTAADHALFDRLTLTSPEHAANAIVAGLKRGRKRVFVGLDARLLHWLRRCLPLSSLDLVAWQARKLAERASQAEPRE
jgi:NAD(P)-dependent dehydrogenase (short-subunit alcohol dehydrogenase family)